MVANATSKEPYEVTLERGSPDVIERLTPEWIDLCVEGPCDEPFYYPSWVVAYLAEFEPEGSLRLLTVRNQGNLRAILPITERSVGVGPLRLRLVRSAANSHFPRFDVIHGAGDEQVVAQVIWSHLRRRRNWDLLQFESAPEGGVAWHLLELAERAGHQTRYHKPDATPYIDLAELEGDVDEIITSMPKSFRSKLRRSLKRLRARGDVDFSIIDHASSPSDIRLAIEEFYAIEASGWKGRAGSAILSDAKTKAFYDRIIDAAIRDQTLAICLLRCDGHLVAAALKLFWNDTVYELKAGYDESYSDSSPGHIIKAFTVATATNQGKRVVDIGGRSDPHKLAWTKLSRPFATCFVANRTLPARLAWMALFRWGPMVRERNIPIPMVIKRLIE